MKNTLKYFLLLAFGVTTFWSCSDDDFRQENINVSSKKTVKKLSLKDLQQDSKIYNAVKKFDKIEVTGSQYKTIVDTDYGFSVDTDEFMYIEDGQNHSYTFRIYRDDLLGNLENLILNYNYENDNYDAYLIEYIVDESDFQNILNYEEILDFSSKTNVTPLPDFDSGLLIQQRAISSFSFECTYNVSFIPTNQGENVGISHGESIEWITVYTLIGCIYNDFNVSVPSIFEGGEGGYSGGPSGGNGPTGGNSSGSNNQPSIPTINTMPVETINNARFNTFVNNALTQEQRDWLTNLENYEARNQIIGYLNSNEANQFAINMHTGYNNQEAVEFAKWAINFFINNPNTTWEQFENWFMGEPQGQDYFYDASFWNNPSNLNFQQQDLPSYDDFHAGFPRTANGNYLHGADNIYNLVGGNVKQTRINYPVQTENTCALKVSIALNYSGVVIPNITNQTIEGGGDYAGQYFFLNVRALNNWMRATFGTSDPNDGYPYNENHVWYTSSETGTNGVNLPGLVSGLKGIYTIMRPNTSQYSGITGHADILRPNGTCPSNCNFQIPVDRVDIWILE